MFGFSHFLVNLHGGSVVCIWSLEAMISERVNFAGGTGFNFLYNMRPAAFNELVNSGVVKH
eukprot:941619-Lingulodinium_polyedra.AAC.1